MTPPPSTSRRSMTNNALCYSGPFVINESCINMSLAYDLGFLVKSDLPDRKGIHEAVNNILS